jgi:hypothetical protein
VQGDEKTSQYYVRRNRRDAMLSGLLEVAVAHRPRLCSKRIVMTSINEIVATYIAAWNETDAAKRSALIAKVWSDDGGYRDAHRESSGHGAIDAMIGGTQALFAGYRFRLASSIEAHHDCVRFSWTAGGTAEAPLFFAGTDFAVRAPDGRFRIVTGFIDAMPDMAG